MDKQSLSQKCLDKSNAVTPMDRRPKVWISFQKQGMAVSSDGEAVTHVPSDLEEALDRLISDLKADFPTVAITLKNVIATSSTED
jgi:hypothetical protein